MKSVQIVFDARGGLYGFVSDGDAIAMVGIINRSNITRQAVERYAAKDA